MLILCSEHVGGALCLHARSERWPLGTVCFQWSPRPACVRIDQDKLKVNSVNLTGRAEDECTMVSEYGGDCLYKGQTMKRDIMVRKSDDKCFRAFRG